MAVSMEPSRRRSVLYLQGVDLCQSPLHPQGLAEQPEGCLSLLVVGYLGYYASFAPGDAESPSCESYCRAWLSV